ncbi:MAG: T9SS type A sorting domain-containing protein [Bacteroidetes bacterium]|nr:T9SS type A sorting domain-containing protein [Bacteroidota bacterium]MBK9422754.1 T9SS type A sorting domain-containing protein [Bacteroidota bacterium]
MPPDSSVITNFDLQLYTCLSQATCSLPDSISLKAKPTAITALSNNPQLSLTQDDNSVQIEGDTICWNVSLTNSSVSGTTLANNVFFAINDPAVSGVLSGWHFYPTGSSVPNVLDGVIVPIIDSLAPGAAIGGNLCAAVTDCPVNDSLIFGLYYGWNCGGYPQAPFDTLALCEFQTDSLRMNVIIGQLFSSGKTYETPYKLCDTISFTTCFQNFNEGNLFPQQLVLDSIVDGIDIISGTMSNGTLSVQLTATVNDSLWLIHPDSIALLYPSGGFNVTSSDFCVTMTASLGCNFAGSNVLPNKTLYVTNVCGALDSLPVPYTTLGAFVWDTTSYCTDCFTLNKFSNDTLVATGDPVTYQVVACNYNASTNTVALVDLLPSGFIPTTNLPATTTLLPMECDTFAVTGTFFLSGGCPAMTNNAFLIFNGDTTAASACVEVVSSSAICQDSADIVWTGTINSNQLVTTFSDTTIYIADSLVVSDTLRFLECEVIMAAGSSINVVGASGMLILEQTQVYGCDTMWQGINVSQQSQLRISESSLVADANIAVTARHKSVISIIHSNLMDNARNVFIPVTSGVTTNNVSLTLFGDSIGVLKNQFLPRYNGQAAFGSIPMSGVETNRWVGTIGTTGLEKNVFFNMMRGVVGKVSFVRCENNDFIDMLKDSTAPTSTSDHAKGINVVSELSQAPSSLHVTSNNYFFNNIYGIYTSNCKTTVRGVLMDTVRYGVHMRNCIDTLTADISSNTINSYFRGIDLMNNAGSAGISVRENFINVNSTISASAGVHLSENTSGNARYTIDGNIIDYKSSYGIVSQNAKYVVITGNVLTQPAFTQSTSNYGIMLNNADTSVVSCNSVTSANNPLYTYSTGIDISLSDKSTITCNTTSGHYKGIFFGGGNAETDFRGNTIGGHYVGLYLNSAAVISQQPPVTNPMPEYHGNVWLDSANYLSGYGAVNLNATPAPNLALSLFSTNQSVNFHNPIIPLDDTFGPFYVDDGTWFDRLPAGSSFDCATYLVCGENSLNGGEHLRMQIVNDETITSDFIPESKYIAKQQLYETFANDEVLAHSKPEYIDFVDNQSTTSVGTLFHTDKLINEAISLGSFGTQFNELLESLILATDSISILDSLIANNMQAGFIETRNLLLEQVSGIQSQLELEIASKEQFKNQKIAAAISANLSVVPTQIPDENEKNVNDAYLTFETGGIAQLESRYSQLFLIANQCKYKGGPAVIRARNLLQLLDETFYFDDNSICEAVGIYRNTTTTSTSIQPRNKIAIQPNPAKNSFEVLVDFTVEETISLTIMDILGNVVYGKETTLSATTNPITVSSEQMLSGVYTVTVKSGNINYTPAKIVIIK